MPKDLPTALSAAGALTIRSHWFKALLILGITLCVVIGFYWQTAMAMATTWWRSETFAHGMLVIPIALFMIWTRRRALAALEPTRNLLGLAALALACLIWLVAYAADVLVIEQFALVAMVPALVLALLGRSITWGIAFPLAYLFFAVPVGEFLVPALQDFTALFTVKALRLTGIPVFWEGRFIFIPNGAFEVAEACSGLRYLIASLALGCLYAYLTYLSLGRRLAFIAISIAVPIIANGLRAYGIVMIAYLSGMKYAVGIDHLIYGWIFFGLVILLMFWIGSFWREDHPQKAAQKSALGAFSDSTRHGWLAATAVASVVIAALGPLGVAWLNSATAEPTSLALPAPAAPAPWSGPAASDDSWKPTFIGADSILHQVYYLDNRPVYLYIAFYRYQRQGAELTSFANNIYGGWSYAGETLTTVSLSDDERLRVRAGQMGFGAQRRLLWYWYWVAGRDTTSPVMVKLLAAWDHLSRLQRGSALIAVSADYEIKPEEATVLLEHFLSAMRPGLFAALERPR